MMPKKTLKIGLIGYRFMGKAHSNAWRQAPRFFDLKRDVRLHTICGRNTDEVERRARNLAGIMPSTIGGRWWPIRRST